MNMAENCGLFGRIALGVQVVLATVPCVVPGMVARALFESCTSSHGAAFPQWCGTHLDDAQAANRAYPMLVVKEFPTGVKGVMVASFLAAMMSSLSAVFNSAATVFTYDVYERFAYGPEGNGPPRILVNVGRITTVALTFLTFMWLPVIQASQQSLYIVAQNAMTHVAPPVTAIFLAALLWRRANGEGALAALAAGSITGGIRLVVTMMSQDYCSSFVDPVTRVITLNGQNWFRCLNFNYFSMALFVFSLTILVAVSLCYPPPHEHKLAGRMFHSELLSNALRIILRRKAPASGGSVNMPHTHYSRFVSTDNDPLPSTPRLPPPTESSAEFTEVMAATNHGRVSEDPTPASETRRLQEDDWGDMGTEDEDKDPVLGACSCRCHWFGAHQGKLANVFAAALVIVVSTLIGVMR
ncbi:unnamed protein product [Ostreobium quekettii]|uniref:Sodium/solute symporter n=1 Tax=Ostreobium quekettii TaxID=121088 RepID=A0A8S1IT90_9CHLO|nr:unnamed protein product [Ostreobium quekettii]